MDAMQRFFRKLTFLFQRKKFTSELEEEMAFHREQSQQQLETDGMSSAAARDTARRQFGNTALLKEKSVETVGFRFETLWQDFRYGLRQLEKSPGFSTTAVLVLALGIGATTAIFSALNPILFEPLPYPQADRIMMIWDTYQGARADVTFNTYRELADRSRALETLAVSRVWQPTLTSEQEPERFDGQRVTSTYFQVLGVPPALGRDFQTADDVLHGPKVVILSDALWRRRFNGDASVLGKQVTLDGDLYSVIGVMPHGFENVLAPSTELWTPLQYSTSNINEQQTQEWGHHLHLVARLRPGISEEQARNDLTFIAHSPVPTFSRPPWASLRQGFIADSLQREITRSVKPALVAVLVAVTLMLVIACVNVTSLLLAKGAQRGGEFAVRTALGAGRSRILRQLVTESLLLAMIGGAVGMILARWGIRVLVSLSPPGLPRVDDIRLDPVVLAFGIGVTAVVGLIVGVIPALQATHSDPRSGLQQVSRQTTGGGQKARRTLVVVEVALALMLLVSAGLLLHSLGRLFSVDPGFDTAKMLTMQVQTSGHQFHDDAVRRRFFERALEAAQHVPGVTAAGFTSLLPLSDDLYGAYGVTLEDDKAGGANDAYRYVVTPGYIETMGIPLRRGRLLDARDKADAPYAVVISETMAKVFSGRDPIGQRMHIGPMNRPWYTVVGVVSDVRQASLAESQLRAVYITMDQSWFADDAMSLVARTQGNPAAMAPSIRNAIWSVDKDQPIVRVGTMQSLLAATETQRRFALILFEAFALVGLTLAATGIYGLLSFSVTNRMREIGIRAALGASRTSILALVIRQGMMLTGIGILLGLIGAVGASRAITSLLFGTSQLDPITYVGVIVLMFAVAGIACAVPAWRASRVDPMVALRYE